MVRYTEIWELRYVWILVVVRVTFVVDGAFNGIDEDAGINDTGSTAAGK